MITTAETLRGQLYRRQGIFDLVRQFLSNVLPRGDLFGTLQLLCAVTEICNHPIKGVG